MKKRKSKEINSTANKENICEKKMNMSSNRNTMNHNLFHEYQQHIEYHRETFPFATPPLNQE